MYTPKNEILKAYLENNEAKSAKIGKDEILISVEDVDEIISRVENQSAVKCGNCGDEVRMISTGEICPNCFC